MKSIRQYIFNILLTFLLVFFLLFSELTVFAKVCVLNAGTFRTVAVQQQLEEKAYTSLESYFQTRVNSTGIPAEVYLDTIDKQSLQDAIYGSVEQAFAYLTGRTDTFAHTMDFTALEASVEDFFSDYADENGFQKDSVYEEKLNSSIQEAEDEILFVTDTFKFSVMYENGWLAAARRYVSFLDPAVAGCLIGTVLFLLLLLLCNRKQPVQLLYWGGLSAMTAGLLLAVPCLYVTATNYFAGFAIKDPQIFAAVVGYLELLTGRAGILSAVTIAAAVLCLLVFGLVHIRHTNSHTDS